MSLELERTLLGSLILNPALLESCDLSATDFSAGQARACFSMITSIWEDRRPTEVDTILLADQLGGDGAASFISGCIDGNIKLEPAAFAERARELRRRRLTAQARHLLHEQDTLPEYDLTEIRPLFDELDRLAAEANLQTASERAAPMSVTLADVEPRTVPWLWTDFIPLGRATLISGDPGCGKSWFCLDLAARLSRGLGWPDGSPGCGAARTYYITVEDDLHDTIRPRIDSLGGNPAMITCYNYEQPLHLDLSSGEGLARLESEIARLGDVRLVVIDPIIDFTGDSSPDKTEKVRALLTPLIKLATRLNFALVMVGHLNKAQALSAIYRAGGSTGGWLGKCRAAFMVFRDADDRTLRRVVPIKANLAPKDPPQLEFRIVSGRLEIDVSQDEVDVEAQLNPQLGRRPRERDEALEWLEKFFGDKTEIAAREIEEAAIRKGFSESTLKRAKKAAGFRSKKITDSNGDQIWLWARRAEGQ